MRIFVAGATGAVGKRLIPLLLSHGHHVIATTRSAEKLEPLREQGADPIVVDGLDKDAVMEAVVASRPDAIVHQMTALASMRSLKHFDREFALTNRLRTEGTDHLLAAARKTDARKFIAQGYTGWTNPPSGSQLKTEDDPLNPNPPKTMASTLAALRELENKVTRSSEIAGTVLRYGNLYGPDTGFAPNGELTRLVRARRFPIVGEGAGVWSFLHTEDAAGAVLRAIEVDAPGIYNIVDDDPAEVRVWLPMFAQTIGAKPPRHLPVWLGRLAIGDAGVSMMTTVRGSSNAKAKRALGWKPVYPTWRDGFRRLFAP